jgi:hypothetical protein
MYCNIIPDALRGGKVEMWGKNSQEKEKQAKDGCGVTRALSP